MREKFEIISWLNQTIDTPLSGRVHIVGDDAEWCLDIVNGQLLFAAHSLQYLQALETVLPALGFESALPVYWRLIQSRYRRQVEERGLGALSWTSKVVAALVQYNSLNVQQAEETLAKLAKDAMESLLGLERATVTWYPVPEGVWHITTMGTPVADLVAYLMSRLRAWQPLCDRICSPHQRPYCENPDALMTVPKGMLSRQMLEGLIRLMQGASIRQLAQAVKQDEVKLAKLLYPYIEHRAIKLWAPVQPLTHLPLLPTKQTTQRLLQTVPLYVGGGDNGHRRFVGSNNLLTKNRRTNNANSLLNKPAGPNNIGDRLSKPLSKTAARTRHLIVCIDDSQAMLEKIDSYLDPEHFELKTVIDPVASVSKICSMKPDLVLMDVSMPTINGNSLCEILKRSYMFKDVPIIMISSNASPLNKATAQSSGATDYLEKPFSKMQLMKVLETYLEINVNRST